MDASDISHDERDAMVRAALAEQGDSGVTPRHTLFHFHGDGEHGDLNEVARRAGFLTRGADDYMSKPFEPRELALRIDAILRRTGGKPIGPKEVRLGGATFDMERLELTRDGAPQRLTEAEAQLLKTLALHAHAPVERMSLSPDTADITGRAVDVQVTRLRRKLEADPKNPRYLQTVRGVGYMLAPD